LHCKFRCSAEGADFLALGDNVRLRRKSGAMSIVDCRLLFLYRQEIKEFRSRETIIGRSAAISDQPSAIS
jgi:hypothetical protein